VKWTFGLLWGHVILSYHSINYGLKSSFPSDEGKVSLIYVGCTIPNQKSIAFFLDLKRCEKTMWPTERVEAHFTLHRLLLDQLSTVGISNILASSCSCNFITPSPVTATALHPDLMLSPASLLNPKWFTTCFRIQVTYHGCACICLGAGCGAGGEAGGAGNWCCNCCWVALLRMVGYRNELTSIVLQYFGQLLFGAF
jgi:hypothetical protein